MHMIRQAIPLGAIAAMVLFAPAALAENWAVQADTLRTYATLHSLGFEWDVSGDADHDAICRVRYRAVGSSVWLQGLDLLRVDYDGYYADTKADRAYNMLAGSVFFLEPGTKYEVELSLEDPDGGSRRRVVEIDTRPEPVLPAGAVLWVHPDLSLGDGSRQRPLSLTHALNSADPGRVYCLLPGRYGQARLDRSGAEEAPIAWLGSGVGPCRAFDVPQGETRFERLEVSADYVWVEGLHFEKEAAWPDSVTRGGLRGADKARVVVVRGNQFLGYHYSIWLSPDNSAWVISDNTIVGRKDIEQEGNAAFSGEGIELNHSSHHTVAYNTISQVADGISYPQRNVDIFGNDIFDTSDDGLEPDYGYANLRMWGNRIANVQHFAFSFQGMYCGPWYFIRNQVTTARGSLFKFRTSDRMVLVNNTLVANTFGGDAMHHLLHAFVRNNLFIGDGIEHREPWRARLKYKGRSKERGYFTPDLTTPDWRSDWDYSGYDLRQADGSAGSFFWFDERFDTVQALAAAVGIEAHGRHIDRQTAFADYRKPTHPARRQRPILHLNPNAAAIDAGEAVANLADVFSGSAPDLGAFEVGGPAPHFGPRGPDRRDLWLW
ncbi:MAG: hypothetical protein GKR89_21075 [Candidatus Latescibacteria bacterium]|nr:hypothetical protein [Candidatus Latescibacterota bacterium]